jgi:uncharacterized membrane protein
MQDNTVQNNNSAPASKPYNLAPNVEAALSYVLGALSGIFVFLMEKENKFVRFHAMQSIIATVFHLVISIVLGFIPVVGILTPIWSLVGFVLWVFLIYKAYNNEEFELPVIGKLAREQVNK